MKPAAYLLSLARFAFRANPGLYASVLVSLASAGIELLAMASLLPLLSLVSGGRQVGGELMPTLLSMLSLPVTAQSLLWAVLVLFMARILTQVLGQTLALWNGRRVMAQIGSTTFGLIVGELPLAEINEKSIGHYIGMAGEEAFRASVVVIALAQCASTFALSALYFAAIARYSPIGAGLTAGFLALAAAFGARALRSTFRLGARQVVESRAAASVFLDSLNNLKAVRAFSAEGYVTSMYSRLIFGYSRTWFWIDEVAALTRLLPIVLLLLVAAAWLLFAWDDAGTAGLPFIVALIAFFLRLFPTLGQGVSLVMKIASESRSGKDITALLGRASGSAHQGAALGPVESIDVRGVTFRHPKATEPTLENLHLRLVRGRSYALTGRSGVGKSTLADLLLRFHAPDGGTLAVNGLPLESLSTAQLRRRIVLVGQDAAIFNDTIAANVRLGFAASDAQVRAACVAAGADEFIAAMPQGYDTPVQYHGKNLSGGQRQRLAIARALLREPDVLILDESTNALDKPTQAAIIDRVLSAYADRMVVLVTHDPDVVRRADEVIDLAAMRPGA